MTYSGTDQTTLWLFTSLSSGSSQIVTATSRLETILKANKIGFKALDVATDDKARTLWGRRAGKRKLPGLVRAGEVLADINEVEEWNEYGEIKEMLAAEGEAPPAPAPTPAATAVPSTQTPAAAPPAASKEAGGVTAAPEAPKAVQPPPGAAANPMAATLQQLGFEAAEKANQVKAKLKSPGYKPTTPTTAASPSAKTAPEKLDDSAVIPPPSGESTAEEAKAPSSSQATNNATSEAESTTTSTTTTTEAASSPSTAKEDSTATTASELPSEPATAGNSSTHDLAERPASNIPDEEHHRSSTISAASAEEIAAAEDANKIQEEPELEKQAEAEALTEAPLEKQVSPGAAKQELWVQDPEHTSPLPRERRSEEKRDNEQHVKFVGETPGDELDRVKAVLGGGSNGGNEKTATSEAAPGADKVVVHEHTLHPSRTDASAAPSAIAAEGIDESSETPVADAPSTDPSGLAAAHAQPSLREHPATQAEVEIAKADAAAAPSALAASHDDDANAEKAEGAASATASETGPAATAANDADDA